MVLADALLVFFGMLAVGQAAGVALRTAQGMVPACGMGVAGGFGGFVVAAYFGAEDGTLTRPVFPFLFLFGLLAAYDGGLAGAERSATGQGQGGSASFCLAVGALLSVAVDALAGHPLDIAGLLFSVPSLVAGLQPFGVAPIGFCPHDAGHIGAVCYGDILAWPTPHEGVAAESVSA